MKWYPIFTICFSMAFILLMLFTLYKTFSVLKHISIIAKLLVRSQREKNEQHMRFIKNKSKFKNEKERETFNLLKETINGDNFKVH
jgi:hypothetical protein